MGPGTVAAPSLYLYFKASGIPEGTSFGYMQFPGRCLRPCMGSKDSVYSRIFQYVVFLNHFFTAKSIFLTGLEYKFHVTGKLAAQL